MGLQYRIIGIFDSNGYYWHYLEDIGKIKVDGDEDPEGGYWVDSVEDAIQTLIQEEYIEPRDIHGEIRAQLSVMLEPKDAIT